MGTLQQMLQHQPPIFLSENVSLEHNHNSRHICEITHPFVCSALGTPVVFDACQVGRYAHKVRAYWTNLAPSNLLQASISARQRRPDQVVQEILEDHHLQRPATRSDAPPFYPANIFDPVLPRP